MRCKCKILSVNGVPASDGSIVPLNVMEEYLRSEECQEALKMHKMIGSLTHRSRSIQANFPDSANTLQKTIGKDDSLIIVSDKSPAPTHYIEDLFIEDGWLYGIMKVLDEAGMDDLAIQNIRRLKGMLKQGILPGVSAVIVGYWDSNSSTGGDILKKFVTCKGIDVTLNPSWKKATVTEVYDDVEPDSREFSEKEITNLNSEDYKFTGIKCKTFSNLDGLGINTPKSSKIEGKFTKLMAKVFSADGVVNEIPDVEVDAVEKEKTYSAMSVNERVRMAKLSPRERFRRLILDYRQALKSQGGVNKIDEETLKTMKSLFAGDVLNIMSVVTPMVLEGKNLLTLLNAGALGVEVRKACQAMFIPYRQALQEVGKTGAISKARYSKITAAYTDFIKALQNYVFGPEPIAEEETKGEEESK